MPWKRYVNRTECWARVVQDDVEDIVGSTGRTTAYGGDMVVNQNLRGQTFTYVLTRDEFDNNWRDPRDVDTDTSESEYGDPAELEGSTPWTRTSPQMRTTLWMGASPPCGDTPPSHRHPPEADEEPTPTSEDTARGTRTRRRRHPPRAPRRRRHPVTQRQAGTHRTSPRTETRHRPCRQCRAPQPHRSPRKLPQAPERAKPPSRIRRPWKPPHQTRSRPQPRRHSHRGPILGTRRRGNRYGGRGKPAESSSTDENAGGDEGAAPTPTENVPDAPVEPNTNTETTAATGGEETATEPAPSADTASKTGVQAEESDAQAPDGAVETVTPEKLPGAHRKDPEPSA
jgi:hypothetical protein